MPIIPAHRVDRIDSTDYDDMCAIVDWTAGRAIDHDGHVIAVPTAAGEVHANPGDYVIATPDGLVVARPVVPAGLTWTLAPGHDDQATSTASAGRLTGSAPG